MDIVDCRGRLNVPESVKSLIGIMSNGFLHDPSVDRSKDYEILIGCIYEKELSAIRELIDRDLLDIPDHFKNIKTIKKNLSELDPSKYRVFFVESTILPSVRICGLYRE